MIKDVQLDTDLTTYVENKEVVYPPACSAKDTCPVCGCTNLKFDRFEVVGDTIKYPWSCPNCGRSGSEQAKICFDGHRVALDQANITYTDDFNVGNIMDSAEDFTRDSRGIHAVLRLPIEIEGEELYSGRTDVKVEYLPSTGRLLALCRGSDFPRRIALTEEEEHELYEAMDWVCRLRYGVRLRTLWDSQAKPDLRNDHAEMIRVQHGQLELFLEQSHWHGGFVMAGFSVEGDSKIYYMNPKSPLTIGGRPSGCIIELIDEEIKQQVQAELDEYAAKFLRTDVYSSRHHPGPRFNNALLAGAELEISPDRYKTVHTDMVKGLILRAIDQKDIIYDIFNRTLRMPEAGIIGNIYGDHQRSMEIVRAQRKAGIAPPAVEEIYRINDWLCGKKSVRLVMKNGKEHVYKSQWENHIDLSDLVYMYYETGIAYPSLFFNDDAGFRPKMGCQTEVEKLYSLKFGRDELVVDTTALQDFQMPKVSQ